MPATTDRSSLASISADGRLVAVTSDADNLVAGDGNFDTDIFVHDRRPRPPSGQVWRPMGPRPALSWPAGTSPSAPTARWWPSGRRGALVAEDGGFPVDVFVHDEQP